MSKARIAVLGGGVSGISVSLELLQRGFEVVLLEARDYFGGRIQSFELPGIDGPLEAGAHWIEGKVHYKGRPSYIEAQARLASVGINLGLSRLFYQGECIEPDVFNWLKRHAKLVYQMTQTFDGTLSVAEAFAKAFKRVERDPHLKGFTTEKLFDLTRAVFDLHYYAVDRGVALDELQNNHSTRATTKGYRAVEEWYDKHFAKLVLNGYHRFPDSLLEQIEKQHAKSFTGLLEHEVLAVNSGSNGVVLEVTYRGRTKTFEADAVVSTLPSGVLKEKSATLFRPGLSRARRDALQGLRQSRANKVFLVFREVFWHNDVPMLWISDTPHKTPFQVLNLAYPSIKKGPGLVFWFNDTRAIYREPRELIEQAMASLRSIYGDAVTSPRAAHVTDWLSDDFARGAWTASGCLGEPKENKQCAADFLPVARVFFAGEFASAFGGNVHGAFTTAINTAEAVEDFFQQGLDEVAKWCADETLLPPLHSNRVKSCYRVKHEPVPFCPLQYCVLQDKLTAFERLVSKGVSLAGESASTPEDFTVLAESAYEDPEKVRLYLRRYTALAPDAARRDLFYLGEALACPKIPEFFNTLRGLVDEATAPEAVSTT